MLSDILAAAPDLKSTDYLIALAMAYFVIKELFKVINSKKNAPTEIIRVTDESELEFRRQAAVEHKEMIGVLQKINTELIGNSAVSKSTNQKCENIKENMIIVKDRIVNQ